MDAGLSEAIANIKTHQPFSSKFAVKVLNNEAESPFPQIQGLKPIVRGNDNGISEEENTRRALGYAYLSRYGIDPQQSWGQALMNNKDAEFLSQLNEKMGRYKPKLGFEYDKNWFRNSFIDFLDGAPKANALDLQSKVESSIKFHFSKADTSLIDLYWKAQSRASALGTRLVREYQDLGKMPNEGWLAFRIRRLFNRFRLQDDRFSDQVAGSQGARIGTNAPQPDTTEAVRAFDGNQEVGSASGGGWLKDGLGRLLTLLGLRQIPRRTSTVKPTGDQASPQRK